MSNAFYLISIKNAKYIKWEYASKNKIFTWIIKMLKIASFYRAIRVTFKVMLKSMLPSNAGEITKIIEQDKFYDLCATLKVIEFS